MILIESHMIFREPQKNDGESIWNLVKKSKPLDLNSRYCYLLLCTHFKETCVVGEDDKGSIKGFISAYKLPKQPSSLFIWQIAVDESVRGIGIATSMVKHLLQRKSTSGVSYIGASVTHSNQVSRSFIFSLAKKLNTECKESRLFPKEFFGEENHGEEILLRFGPFNLNKRNDL